MSTRFKICCIRSVEEADLAIRSGASAVGLVSEMPSGPGVITEAEIAEIAREIRTEVETVLLTSRVDVGGIVGQLERSGVRTVQLVDRLESIQHEDLRRAVPEVRIIQVLHVVGEGVIEEARRVAPSVDALLLDSGRPHPSRIDGPRTRI